MNARLASSGAVILIACVLGACAPETGQTGLVAIVSTSGPVDCLSVAVNKPGGQSVRAEVPIGDASTWRSASYRVLVYSGGLLGDGAVELSATGHRGGCSTPPVARGQASSRFEQGKVIDVPVAVTLVGADADGDGFADTEDCRPQDPDIYPRSGNESAPDDCDGFDNDCDGVVDEGCPCEDARPCHPLGLSHPSAGAGACVLGTQACVDGRLGTCDGAVLPAPEACDGVDTDCDGALDPESCPCVDGDTRDCYVAGPARFAGVGACTVGVQTCVNESYGPCLGSVGPTREACNEVDDDCDGAVDEADEVTLEACELTQGVCAGASRACDGRVGPCSTDDYQDAARRIGATYVGLEGADDCDGVDNDCDGDIDEGCPCTPGDTEACHPLGAHRPESATGQCQRGTRTCGPDGQWSACDGFVAPAEETCNGLDDDCDGLVDDGLAEEGVACATGESGRCGPGVRRCLDGTLSCVSVEPAGAEQCNGIDDDCDSETDEDFDLLNDPAHCGSACVVCAAGDVCCGGQCATTATDWAHCGACGAKCEAGESCCNGGCVDFQQNVLHCGLCGRSCAVGDVCRAGQCVPPAELACHDGDDDADGLADCADSDCAEEVSCNAAGEPARVCRGGQCVPSGETSCTNGVDDDHDGAADCGDSDCGAGAVCDGNDGTCCGGACAHETECTNGTDDDCDGLIDCQDSDCGCAGGATCCGVVCRDLNADPEHCGECGIACGDTDACTDDLCVKGQCQNNVLPDRSPGACGANAVCCGGGCAPSAESQCVNGVDDDCDGLVDCQDSDCPCPGNGTCCNGQCVNAQDDNQNCGGCNRTCAPAGLCQVAQCTDGSCAQDNRPDGESCGSNLGCCGGSCVSSVELSCGNGEDDDCDGLIDCADPDCVKPEVAEICNGLDDNCDGTIDETLGVGDACSVGTGACETVGAMRCQPDGSVACDATQGSPSKERCNGEDDDCNGVIDDGYQIGAPCSAGVGACLRAGSIQCSNPSSTYCTAVAGLPTAELCNGADDDCDDLIDEDPSREVCNGLDDDCDSAVDEAPECGGPPTDVAESVMTTWLVGESTGDTLEPCNPVVRGHVSANATSPTNTQVGTEAIRINHTGSSYFQGAYPAGGDANWDLSTRTGLHFYLRATQPNDYDGWEPRGPTIVLCGPSGHMTLTPATNQLVDSVVEHSVPLAGNARWTVSTSGTFNLTEVDSVEFHADPDTGGESGTARMFLDDVRFY